MRAGEGIQTRTSSRPTGSLFGGLFRSTGQQKYHRHHYPSGYMATYPLYSSPYYGPSYYGGYYPSSPGIIIAIVLIILIILVVSLILASRRKVTQP
jgi:hypothetical protein